MATLWKRATPSQYRMLRAIAGAVANAAHAHQVNVPNSFARSVAKRATGTLTAQWPDVLAAKTNRRQIALQGEVGRLGRRRSEPAEGPSKGDRRGTIRRSPIRSLWKRYAVQMWAIKNSGDAERFAAHVRVLQLLDQAQRELDALECAASPSCHETTGERQ